MSREFSSVEEAKHYAAAMAGLDPDKVTFEEVSNLKVSTIADHLLSDPKTPERVKASIRKRRKAQKVFKFMTPNGEAKIVIGPFRDGFDCWAIGENGFAMSF
ncbi:MAG: hypothetical protein WC528_02685 [Patescibacteria group bacterium]